MSKFEIGLMYVYTLPMVEWGVLSLSWDEMMHHEFQLSNVESCQDWNGLCIRVELECLFRFVAVGFPGDCYL